MSIEYFYVNGRRNNNRRPVIVPSLRTRTAEPPSSLPAFFPILAHSFQLVQNYFCGGSRCQQRVYPRHRSSHYFRMGYRHWEVIPYSATYLIGGVVPILQGYYGRLSVTIRLAGKRHGERETRHFLFLPRPSTLDTFPSSSPFTAHRLLS